MCSNKCANPVRFRGSIRNPIRYITSTTTTGAAWFSLTTTRRPLGSFRYATGTEKLDPADAAGPDAAADGCADCAGAASAARETASRRMRITRECSIRVLDDTSRGKDCGIAGLQDCRIAGLKIEG